ncbi:hypothetical protein [Pedobacter cryoconitis]|uniref:Uncharacterized protein n=1 Tax=Pedobacter cryoconitis TaxID=188932 RepID=A0A7X0J692_9SPHI|nr:hypothetical protein [Pedobacter cryoconitis]MBB6500411.1 hypothetical protein [Pedobacter cryoconitis]
MKKKYLIAMGLFMPLTIMAQTVNYSPNGNVGLGTDSPKEKLDVAGNIFLRNIRNATGAGASVSFSSFDSNDTGPKISSYLDFASGTDSQARLILSSYSRGFNNELTLMNGNVGIGVIEPKEKLDVVGNIYLRNMTNAIGGGASVSFSSFDNNSPGPKISSYLDYAQGTNSRSRLILSSYSSGYQNELTLMSGNVGIGTINPTERLSVNGKISAGEIKVEVRNWPDYVFSKKYELPSLHEVENYINKNGHLPGMPTAEEVAANGVSLGDLNAKLLEKIEELTLHLIALEKNNEKQQKEIDELKLKK